MISLKQLQAFTKVAALSSFRGAAELLHTTQPNISQRITTLEGLLGVKLFHRDGAHVQLTDKGVQLLPHAHQILGGLDQFIAQAQAGHLHEGVLRLGVTELIVHRWLAAFLQAFKSAFPNIVVELQVDISANLSPLLHDRQLDLAFQSGPFMRSLSGQSELGAYKMCWVASPALGLGGRKISLGDFAAIPVMSHAKGTKPFAQIQEHLIANHANHIRLSPSSNMIACLEMAVSQLGVACLPYVLVAEKVEMGALELVDYEWVPEPLSFAARYHDDDSALYIKEAAKLGAALAAADQL